MPGCKKDAEPKVDHLTQEEPFPRLHRIFLRVRPTHDVRMLALIAIMKVGIEVRAAPMRHLQATTIAIGDVKTQEMTDANTNAILEFDTSARGRRRIRAGRGAAAAESTPPPYRFFMAGTCTPSRGAT